MLESSMQDIRREDQVLLYCFSTFPNSDKAPKIRTLAQQGLDWTYLLWRAFRDGVPPLVYRELMAVCPELVPEPVLAKLRYLYQSTLGGNLFSSRNVTEILTILEKNEIPAYTVGGPILSALVYRDLALRKGGFPSVIVRRKDMDRALNRLLSLGYEPYKNPGRIFLSHRGRLVARLQRDLFLERPFPIDPVAAWGRLVPLSLDGDRSVRTISPEDFIPLLCAEPPESGGFLPACDIARLIDSYQNLNWDYIIKQARRQGRENQLYLGLLFARNLLGTALPDKIMRQVLTKKRLESRTDKWTKRILSARPPTRKEIVHIHLTARDRFWDKIRFGINLILFPKRAYAEYEFTRQRLICPDKVPFSPTPFSVVDRMLALARLGPEDIVYDLGCGDGRIVIRAAKYFGAQGVGIDNDPRRIANSEAFARQEKIGGMVTFVKRNAHKVDLSRATAVMLYMCSGWILKIRGKLRKELKPGSRIVSLSSDLGDWPPDEIEFVTHGLGSIDAVYLWHIKNSENRPSKTRSIFCQKEPVRLRRSS